MLVNVTPPAASDPDDSLVIPWWASRIATGIYIGLAVTALVVGVGWAAWLGMSQPPGDASPVALPRAVGLSPVVFGLSGAALAAARARRAELATQYRFERGMPPDWAAGRHSAGYGIAIGVLGVALGIIATTVEIVDPSPGGSLLPDIFIPLLGILGGMYFSVSKYFSDLKDEREHERRYWRLSAQAQKVGDLAEKIERMEHVLAVRKHQQEDFSRQADRARRDLRKARTAIRKLRARSAWERWVEPVLLDVLGSIVLAVIFWLLNKLVERL
jgi:ABC-type multidrug transport system fused ATPase/permease subunit